MDQETQEGDQKTEDLRNAAFAPVEGDMYMAIAKARRNKAVMWLTNPWTNMKLTATTLAVRPSLPLLGRFFKECRRGAEGSVVTWAHASTNPGYRACLKYCALLKDAAHEHWTPVRGEGWTGQTLRLTAILTFKMLGNVFFRTVRPFLVWPWRLANLVHAETSEAEREQICNEVMQMRPCCCDNEFTSLVKAKAATVQDLQSTGMKQFLSDAFQMCEPTNIKSEDRFSRTRRQTDSCQGNWPSPSTVAAGHMLSEFESHFKQAVHECRAQHLYVCI